MTGSLCGTIAAQAFYISIKKRGAKIEDYLDACRHARHHFAGSRLFT